MLRRDTQFFPTLQLRWAKREGRLILEQLWMTAVGGTSWRRVPVVQAGGEEEQHSKAEPDVDL